MSKALYSSLPVKSRIKEKYENYTPLFTEIRENIHTKLRQNIHLSTQPVYKTRIKNFSSYYKKLLRLKSTEAASFPTLVCLTDIIGIRIICTFLEDIAVILKQLKTMFDIKEIERKGAELNFKEFGYESVHVLVAIPKDCLPAHIPSTLPVPEDLVCEIQIRTILQDAWAEVEHELIYKSEFTPFDMPLRRKLASMNASLNLADIIFQEIRDYQKKLQDEMNERKFQFYKIADTITNAQLSVQIEGKDASIERINPYVRGTIDDLLLQAIQAHNTGEFDRAISIYTEIIESKPEPNNIVLSVILKHRGMAYFIKNDYAHALADFQQSFTFDPNSFQSKYYEGIVQTIQKDYKSAVKCFDLSLKLNAYQSHAYYRRAIALFELHEYESSMNDVVSAKNLGLEDQGLERLHEKLLKKFDML
ncbi:MAG: (p)ppGpp synthetase [Treponema sp.]